MTSNSTTYDDWTDQQLEQDLDPRNLFPEPDVFVVNLRSRFARKTNLTRQHHDQLITDERPVVLWEMGTDHR